MASEIPSRWHDGALGELFEPMEPKFMIEDLDPKPSDLVRASPHLMSCLTYGMKVEEAERQAQRAFALGCMRREESITQPICVAYFYRSL